MPDAGRFEPAEYLPPASVALRDFGSFENVFGVFLPGVLGLILIGAGAIMFRRERIR